MNNAFLKAVLWLMILTISNSAYPQQKITKYEELSVRLTLLKYCTQLKRYGHSYDADEYDQIISLFSHREVQVFDDLASGWRETSIYNYLTKIDQQRTPGFQIKYSYNPAPAGAEMTIINKKKGKEAQIVLRKSIWGGTERHQKTITNVIYISLEDYKITGVFNAIPDFETVDESKGEIVSRSIFVKNGCSSNINLTVSYQDTTSTWQSLGIWTINAGNQNTLNVSDNEVLKTANSTIYFHAETQDNSLKWAGEHLKAFRGEQFPMMKFTMGVGPTKAFEFELKCEVPNN